MAILVTSPAWAKNVPLVEVAAGWEEGQYFHWAADVAGRTSRSRLLVQPTNGSAQSVSHLATGRVGLAVAQGDVVWHSRYNSGRVSQDDELVAIGKLFEEMVHVVVLAAGELRTLDDLHGRHIGVGAVGSGSLFNALDVLSAAGIADAQLDFTSAFLLDRMLEGQLDAAIVTARVPFLPVIEDERFKVISIPLDVLDEAPYYRLAAFPSNYGEGVSVYIPSLLVGHASLSDRVVTELIEIGGLDPVGVTVPLHPAASKFYKRRGAVISELQPKFLPPELPQLPTVSEWGEGSADGLEQRTLTTNQVVSEAIRRDPVLKSLVLHQRRSELAVEQVQTSFAPTLSMSTGGLGAGAATGSTSGWANDVAMSVWAPTGTTISSTLGMSSSNISGDEVWGAETSLSVSQELLDGAGMGANLSTLEQSRLDAAIAKIDTHASAVGLVSDVLTKFYDLNERHERLGLRRDQVDFARRHLNRVRAKTSIGGGHALAFQEANHSKLLAEKELLGEQRLLLDAEDTLLDYMQAHFGYHIVPILGPGAMDIRVVPSVTELTRIALSRRDEVRRQSAVLHKARLAKTAAINAALPSLSANGSVGRTTNGGDGGGIGATLGALGTNTFGNWSLGLAVHHTLGGGSDPIELERVTLSVRVEALALEELVERVKREVRAANRALETVQKQRDVAIAAREIADEKLGLVVEAFRRGEADSFKVIFYQDDYLNSRLEVVAATADYLTASVALDRAMGVILDPYLTLFTSVAE
jgi:TRAP transporter TAXI family solute receptor